jgi:hypothetical protein
MGFVACAGAEIELFERAYRFAHFVDYVVPRAVARMKGEPADLPVVVGTFGWTKPMARTMALLDDELHGASVEELAYGAFLAVRLNWLVLSELHCFACDVKDCLEVGTAVTVALRCLERRRKERSENGLPPEELVVFHLAPHWDTAITKDNFPQISHDLACAFAESVLSIPEAEEIVRPHGMHLLSIDRCRQIAAQALEFVRGRKRIETSGLRQVPSIGEAESAAGGGARSPRSVHAQNSR